MRKSTYRREFVIPLTEAGSPCKKCKAKGSPCHLHGGTPRTESSKWKAIYEKEKKAYIESWRAEHASQYAGVWHTPMARDVTFPSFKAWLKAKEDEHSPRSASPRSKYRKSLSTRMKSTKTSPSAQFDYFDNLPLPALQEVLLDMEPDDLKKMCNMNQRAKQICTSAYFRQNYEERHPQRPTYIFRGGKGETIIYNAKLTHFNSKQGIRYVISGNTRDGKSKSAIIAEESAKDFQKKYGSKLLSSKVF